MTEPTREHDARIYVEVGSARRPYGWSCLKCPARRGGYATGESAKAAAMEHNGGWYDEPKSQREERS